MRFISTADPAMGVSFSQALIQGLPGKKSLFFPERIPALPASFYKELSGLDDCEIAFRVLHPYLSEELSEAELRSIVEQALDFPFPLVQLEADCHILEQFHGPTLAFKDIGARFLARFMGHFVGAEQPVTVLVATSGDTGSAVANGFWRTAGTEVVILFPKGRVSPFQESQMTTLGDNIHALEVEGDFDDCQRMVKAAFLDPELNAKLRLTSANSINVGRLLPQMIYYFLALKQLAADDRKLAVCVPSGNFGNITAGIMASRMGLPIDHFIAATNANDVFVEYLNSGTLNPRPGIPTYSNAMDVGNPSNFERIMHLFGHSVEEVRKEMSAMSYSDGETLAAMRKLHTDCAYLADPHAAVGYLAWRRFRESNPGYRCVLLETAHPLKFDRAVEAAFGPDAPELKAPHPVGYEGEAVKETIAADPEALRGFLLGR